ncbi:hypothetical protein BHM03_00048970 [Ensete ventricosum]|nr:hypothetical protein BHM03_00048970 [Ensete ventricosum]
MALNFTQSHVQSQVFLGFLCTVSDIKILVIPNVLAHGNSYEYDFMKKLSQNFKILAIHNMLADWKSYEHGFTDKRDVH